MRKILSHSIPMLALGATLLGTVSAAGWTFYIGSAEKNANAVGTINNEWTFDPTPKALLVNDGSDIVVYLVYDKNEYAAGDLYKGMSILDVDDNFDRVFDASGGGDKGFFYDSSPTKVSVDSSFQEYSPTSMNSWFSSCESLVEIENVALINTSSVSSAVGLFNGCSSFLDLNLSSWDVSSMTDTSYMFNNCTGLKDLDLSNWATTSVTNMSYMFSNCTSINSIYASFGSWTVWHVTNSVSMFLNCNNLMGGAGTAFESYSIDKTLGNVDTTSTRGYLTEIYQPRALLVGKTIYFVAGKGYYRVGATYKGETIDKIDYNFSRSPTTKGFFVADKPTKIVFEESFHDYKPTSFYYEFSYLEDLETIEGEENVDTSHVTNFSNVFRKCSSLISADLSSWDTSNATNLQSIFMECGSLVSANLNGFVTSAATRMSSIFYGCSSLTTFDISGWNTENVTSASNVFRNCKLITELDLTGWDVSKVEDMQYTFSGCSSLADLNVSNWNVSSLACPVVNAMFQGCSSLTELDLSSWNTSNLQKTDSMFKDCSSLRTIYADPLLWDMSNVVKGTDMFTGCTSLVGGNGTVFRADHVGLDRANVDGYEGQIGYLTNIIHPTALLVGDTVYFVYGTDIYHVGDTYNGETITGVDTNFANPKYSSFFRSSHPSGYVIDQTFSQYKPKSTSYWFYGVNSLEGLEYLDTSECRNMNYMFYSSTLSDDAVSSIENFDVSKVTSANMAFAFAKYDGTLDLSGWDVSSLTDLDDFFCGAELGNIDVSNWDVSNITSLTFTFGQTVIQGDIIGLNTWDVSSVEFFDATFIYSSVKTLDLTGWQLTSAITTMFMFSDCSELESVNLSGWDTSAVEDMNNMFSRCSSLTVLDLSSFDTSNVMDMGQMFDADASLTTIYATPTLWTTRRVNNSDGMFYGCASLVGGNGTAYNYDHINANYAKIDGYNGQLGYLTDASQRP
ncbi:MAG: DUF285 domain-containing protein [Bacilli bacterium]|nr:DUF285 domain-containing protein [Bacilli bacterium]